MPAPGFAAFRQRIFVAGSETVRERSEPPAAVVDSHPFALAAQIVTDDMWPEVAGATQHLRTSEAFALAAAAPPAERYGPNGTTYRVARRNISGES